MTNANDTDGGSVFKIHKVHQILEDEDGSVYINCLAEFEGSMCDVDLYVPSFNEAYRIKTWCESHIEPYEVTGDLG